jgi:dTDP-4-amino-4,6-dideoxygalactose transaminase
MLQMVDLKTQYSRLKPEIEREMQEVLETCMFIGGPKVNAFRENLEKYLSVKHVIPCANGTDALQIAMMALGLQPGDEVIVPAFTYVATAEVIALLGLIPVMTDVDPGTMNITAAHVEAAITPKTKAIVPVHLFGQSADMEPILEVARKHDLYVIEDNAQAIGADYLYRNGQKVKTGVMGQFGCTSFFPSKNLGCYGDGGAIFTNDDALAVKLRSVVNHGMTVRYYHDDIGVNSRLDSLQAAVLKVKLQYLDEYALARKKVADAYDKAFGKCKELITPVRFPNSTHVFHQYTLKVQGIDRGKLQEFLASKDIPAMIYYPVPIHLQKAYLDPRYKPGDFPVTEKLSESVISLPMHTEMDEDQLNFITSSVLEFLGSENK